MRELGHLGACEVQRALLAECGTRRTIRSIQIQASRFHVSLKVRPVCPECGNRRISPCASWCRMCGAPLGRTVPEKTALMMRLPVPERCPVCGSGESAGGGECPDCGYPRTNHCLAEYDQPRHPNPADARFCEICGAATLYAELAGSPRITRNMPLAGLFR